PRRTSLRLLGRVRRRDSRSRRRRTMGRRARAAAPELGRSDTESRDRPSDRHLLAGRSFHRSSRPRRRQRSPCVVPRRRIARPRSPCPDDRSPAESRVRPLLPRAAARRSCAEHEGAAIEMSAREEREAVIEVRALSKHFGKVQAVEGVSFVIYRGEIFGILGPNGSGKTTAIRVLCGLLTPTSGTAMVAEFDAATQSEEVKAHIGYMSQAFGLYRDLTVEENLRFYGGLYGLGARLD